MLRDEKAAAVLEKLREFDRVADQLEMPSSERIGILNVSEEEYRSLRVILGQAGSEWRPELDRRLSYALPLMRRLASNSAPSGSPDMPPVAVRAL